MKVLFCVDNTEISYKILEKGFSFINKDSEIDLLNVFDLSTIKGFLSNKDLEKLNLKESSLDFLKKLEEHLKGKGGNVQKTFVQEGKPANVILDLINADKYDLVVMGSHSKKMIEKWIGSVSRRVVSKSWIPVLIIKVNEDYEVVNNKYLLAIDGSLYSYNAIKKSIGILDYTNSYNKILTVKPGLESLPIEIVSDKEWLQRALNKQDEIAEATLKESDEIIQYKIKIEEKIILDGDSALKILEFACKDNIDLIILGSHGREGVSELLLGSISKRVLDNSSCSVLIVPDKQMYMSNIKKHLV